MSNWGTAISGLSSVRSTFNKLGVKWGGDAVYLVGTNVEYSIYVEFGTSRQRPQPYLRPAVREWQRSPAGFIVRNRGVHPGDINSLDEFVKQSALAIERRAKDIVPVKSGNLRGSIRAEKVR